MGCERIKYGIVADAWLQGTEPYPVGWRRVCPHWRRVCPHGGKRGEDIRQTMARIAVQGEVAARDDQFTVTGRQEGAGSGENLVEGNRTGFPAKGRDDAKSTFPGTSVLYLQISPGCPEGDGLWDCGTVG